MSNAESAFPKIVTAGADAILVYLGEGIDPDVNDRVHGTNESHWQCIR